MKIYFGANFSDNGLTLPKEIVSWEEASQALGIVLVGPHMEM